jgi:hypothetical protein
VQAQTQTWIDKLELQEITVLFVRQVGHRLLDIVVTDPRLRPARQ